MTVSVEQKTLRLKIRLGELTVAAPALPVEILRSEVFRGDTAVDFSACAEQSLPQDCAGVYLPSIPVADELPQVCISNGKIIYVVQQYPRYFADLTLDYEDYLKSFSSKSRSSLRRKVRKFAEASGGEVDWRVYKEPDELRDFYALAAPLSRQTYQHRMFDAGLPESEVFQREMTALAAEDQVRAFLIFFQGAAIAYLYCPISKGTVQYAYLGYLDEYRDQSPGTVLLWLALEHLYAEGRHEIFDFTEGGVEHGPSQKGFFSTGSVRCADVFVLKLTPGNWLKVYSAVLADRVSAAVGRVLESMGIKSAVRNMLRRLR